MYVTVHDVIKNLNSKYKALHVSYKDNEFTINDKITKKELKINKLLIENLALGVIKESYNREDLTGVGKALLLFDKADKIKI